MGGKSPRCFIPSRTFLPKSADFYRKLLKNKILEKSLYQECHKLPHIATQSHVGQIQLFDLFLNINDIFLSSADSKFWSQLCGIIKII